MPFCSLSNSSSLPPQRVCSAVPLPRTLPSPSLGLSLGVSLTIPHAEEALRALANLCHIPPLYFLPSMLSVTEMLLFFYLFFCSQLCGCGRGVAFLSPVFIPNVVSSVGANCLSNCFSPPQHHSDDWGTQQPSIFVCFEVRMHE